LVSAQAQEKEAAMYKPVLSDHAKERVSQRLGALLSPEAIEKAVATIDSFPIGETQICVKSLGRKVHIEGSHGDTVVAVVRRQSQGDKGCISTVMLRYRYQLRNVKYAFVS
jgi:hypothetical protein